MTIEAFEQQRKPGLLQVFWLTKAILLIAAMHRL
jgi:hypothetical protein